MSAHVLSHILDTRFYVANNLLPDMTEVSLNGRNVSEFLRDEVGRRVKENIENGIVIVP